jgi:hypothetical protein
MSTTILDIYRQFGVRYATEGSKITAGWAGTPCVFCHSSDYHLGVNISKVYWTCWKCGPHRAVESLMALCRVDQHEAVELWRQIAPFGPSPRKDVDAQKRISIHGYKRPSNVIDMLPQHRRYLEGRNFDSDEIAHTWGIKATGPIAWLDGIDYSHRLFIPIEWEGCEVSFQTRDFTGKSDIKYISCPNDREARHHKELIYSHPDCFKHRFGIAVEGVFDCWRLGESAFATFGIKFKREQVIEIAEHFDRVAIAFDRQTGMFGNSVWHGSEALAYRQARRLSWQLRAVGVETMICELPDGDPGSMSPDDAAYLVRDVKRWASA